MLLLDISGPTINGINQNLFLVGIEPSQHDHMTGSLLKQTTTGVYRPTVSLYSMCLFYDIAELDLNAALCLF